MNQVGPCDAAVILKTHSWMGTGFHRSLARSFVAAALGGAVAFAGCARTVPPPATQPDALPTGAEMEARSADITQRAQDLNALAARLAAVSDVASQQPIINDVFKTLAALLPGLAGPAPTGVFVHQFSVVAQIRDQISAFPGRPLAPGTIDDGLMAAYNAVRDLGQTHLYQDDEITQKLDALSKQIMKLQASGGVDHAIAVRDTIVQTAAVTSKMSATLHDRMGGKADAGPASGPATTPVEPPATAPATIPDVTPAPPATLPAAPATLPVTPPATIPPATIPPATTPAETKPDVVPPATAPATTLPPAAPAAPAPADGNK